MVSALELSSRALLCRRFAEQEPANRVLWITEAEHCEQLSQRETSHRKTLSCRICWPSPAEACHASRRWACTENRLMTARICPSVSAPPSNRLPVGITRSNQPKYGCRATRTIRGTDFLAILRSCCFPSPGSRQLWHRRRAKATGFATRGTYDEVNLSQ
jgi:hypothetical protein